MATSSGQGLCSPNALAVGGIGGLTGSVRLNGNALAHATSNGGGGTATSTARSGGPLAINTQATASAPSAGLVESESRAEYGTPAPSISATAGIESVAYLTAAPLNLASYLTGNPNAQAAFASSRPIASGVLKCAYPASSLGAARTFTASANYSLQTSTFAGTEAVRFAVLDAQTLASGFSSLSLQITSRSVSVDSQTFSSPATAVTYLKDRVYNLGTTTASGNQIPIQITLTVTASASDSGFALTFGNVVVDGSSPSGFAAYAATNNVPADYSDTDRDGLNNFVEYALGLSPNTSDGSNASVVGIENVSGSNYPTLTINRASIRSDVSYRVEVSTDLKQWNSGPSYTTVITDNAMQLKVRSNTPITPGAPPQFLRLEVVPQ